VRFVLKLRNLSNNEQLNFCCKLDIMSTPEEGVASLVSPSVASARLVDKDNLVGILSLVLGGAEPRTSKIEEKTTSPDLSTKKEICTEVEKFKQ
jgi:hypothetical protein